jgi:hypothetical protein
VSHNESLKGSRREHHEPQPHFRYAITVKLLKLDGTASDDFLSASEMHRPPRRS